MVSLQRNKASINNELISFLARDDGYLAVDQWRSLNGCF